LKKKECETRKCFKCEKEEHIVKRTQSMKKCKIQEESDNEEDEKKE